MSISLGSSLTGVVGVAILISETRFSLDSASMVYWTFKFNIGHRYLRLNQFYESAQPSCVTLSRSRQPCCLLDPVRAASAVTVHPDSHHQVNSPQFFHPAPKMFPEAFLQPRYQTARGCDGSSGLILSGKPRKVSTRCRPRHPRTFPRILRRYGLANCVFGNPVLGKLGQNHQRVTDPFFAQFFSPHTGLHSIVL